jgi:hypothetical protein
MKMNTALFLVDFGFEEDGAIIPKLMRCRDFLPCLTIK